ncbi:hypothetical protein BDV96DRAFT_652573 [Lophiotrema nucula]|uniref:F-box domain-containing protein n=1 Tax=Lophiotrema nucula TaxID=690887 RepID=A0A6A5YNJ3_9PLEO|nr:hypothetical protein BDV96DRAFT_652573 [Lophiotrema nucula]
MQEPQNTGLLSLPDELLISIISYVADRVPDTDDTVHASTTGLLAILSRTCRRLHRVTRDFLYHSFTVDMQRPGHNDTKIHRLVDTLAQRPELRDLIKSVSFEYPDHVTRPVARYSSVIDQLLRMPGLDELACRRILYLALLEGHSDAAAAHLILLLPKLESMYLSWPGFVQQPEDASLSSLHCFIFDLLEAAGHPTSQDFHGFRALKDLTLDFGTPKPYIRLSGALLLLPNLRKLGLGNILLGRLDEWACPPSTSLVEDLTIITLGSTLFPRLVLLFQSFAHLRHIRLERKVWEDGVNGPIFAALNTQKHALETIEYTILYNRFRGHSTPMLDLRGFSKLRKLAVNDTTLFNMTFEQLSNEQDKREASRHLCASLPSTLQELTHFTRDADEEGTFHAARTAWWRGFWSGYRNEDVFPHLEKVTAALWLDREGSEGII